MNCFQRIDGCKLLKVCCCVDTHLFECKVNFERSQTVAAPSLAHFLDYLLGSRKGHGYIVPKGLVEVAKEKGNFRSLQDSVLIFVIDLKHFSYETSQLLVSKLGQVHPAIKLQRVKRDSLFHNQSLISSLPIVEDITNIEAVNFQVWDATQRSLSDQSELKFDFIGVVGVNFIKNQLQGDGKLFTKQYISRARAKCCLIVVLSNFELVRTVGTIMFRKKQLERWRRPRLMSTSLRATLNFLSLLQRMQMGWSSSTSSKF